MGLGFSDSLTNDDGFDVSGAYAFSSIQGQPWALLIDWHGVQFFAGPQNETLISPNESWGAGPNVATEFRMVLDTTEPQWKTSLYRDNDDFHYGDYTFPANPTINAVGLTKVQGASGIITHFSLEAVTSAGEPGDFNADGLFDGEDLLIWQRGGSPTPLSVGDRQDWETRFGAVSPAASSVPEPSTWVASLLAAAMITAVRRYSCR